MIKIINIFFFLSLLISLNACHTFVGSNGKKVKQLFPDRYRESALIRDTSNYVVHSFGQSNNALQVSQSGKKEIVQLRGGDIPKLAKPGQNTYIIPWNSKCSGSIRKIPVLDSLAEYYNIILVSMFRNYETIDKVLATTSFARQPYYVMATDSTTNILLRSYINFIAAACNNCYATHKDDLVSTNYLLVTQDAVLPVFTADSGNILKEIH